MSKPRFSMVPAGAVTDVRLSMTDIRVLGIMGTFTNNKGWCFPKQEAIAALLKRSRPVVCAALKRLEDCGYVESEKRKGGANRKRYRVILDQRDDGHDLPDDLFEAERDVCPTDISEPEMSKRDVRPVDMSITQTCLPDKHVLAEMSVPPTIDVGPADMQRELEPLNQTERTRKLPCHLPEDWDPRDDEVAFAEGLNFTRSQFDDAIAEFRVYWHGEAAKRTKASRKPNWDLTFRNSLRTLAVRWRTDRQGKVALRAKSLAASEPDWAAAIASCFANSIWEAAWGPRPHEPGYRGPQELTLSILKQYPSGHPMVAQVRANLELARAA